MQRDGPRDRGRSPGIERPDLECVRSCRRFGTGAAVAPYDRLAASSKRQTTVERPGASLSAALPRGHPREGATPWRVESGGEPHALHMNIAALDVFPVSLPFREEFRISRGSVGSPEEGAPHVYVRVTADDGSVGWGEARPSHRWSYETLESVVASIRRYLAPALVGVSAWDLREIGARMDRQLAPGISTGNPVARSGIDIAVHDLLARAAGVPLSAF